MAYPGHDQKCRAVPGEHDYKGALRGNVLAPNAPDSRTVSSRLAKSLLQEAGKEDQNKPRAERRKNTIKIRVGINESENKKMVGKKVMKQKSGALHKSQ